MSLSAGTRIGPYEIVSTLGTGGMGEVYKARDPRLNRDVALKVAHGPFSERVEREARAIAALNHPNVCVLHDVGSNYLVMELVEGATLADRIKRGPLPEAEALAIATGIANALEAAHDRGIVHRDLKPGNVKLRPDGSVKVLDFGLAKLVEAPAYDVETTVGSPMTEPGAVLGTPAYMAPEQARGLPVDARADIWAFGIVLFEMLSGRRPFQGATVTDTLAAVLTGPLDWHLLPPDVPPKIRRLLRRCLERDPRQRLRAIADARLEIEDINDSGPVTSAAPSTIATPRSARWVWIAGAGGVLLGALAIWSLRPATSARSADLSTRWTMAMPEPKYGGTGVALSRDGTMLAYAEWAGGQSRIMLRRLDQLAARPVPGTEGGVRPCFSPDGHWIAYFSTNPLELRKTPVSGGASVRLADANFLGIAWTEDDTIVFSGSGMPGNGLMRVPSAGGQPIALTRLNAAKGETSHQWPSLLPGGQAVLFTIDAKVTGLDARQIAIADLKTGTYQTLLSGGSAARYVPTGHLVYVRNGTMYSVPFDAKARRVTGAEAVVEENVYFNPERGFADYTFADSGLLVYAAAATVRTAKQLAWVDRDGTARPAPIADQPYSAAELSPDGTRAVLTIRNSEAETSDLWVADFARRGLKRLTSEGTNLDPIWSPDGRRIIFRTRRAQNEIDWIDADGSRQPQKIRESNSREAPSSWSPDDASILYTSASQGRGQIWVLPVNATGHGGEPRPLVVTASDDLDASYSPDGRWIAYTSDESGRYEVYVRSVDGSAVFAVSSEGGESPHWSRDGHELLYREPLSSEIMTADTQLTPTFTASRPRRVVALRGLFWDVTRDGLHFLVGQSGDDTRGARLQIVTNWFSQLNRR
jgi:Tol biopolymer transport system component/tRNA A-37 threonylcarbamoyl transferase component Bud32